MSSDETRIRSRLNELTGPGHAALRMAGGAYLSMHPESRIWPASLRVSDHPGGWAGGCRSKRVALFTSAADARQTHRQWADQAYWPHGAEVLSMDTYVRGSIVTNSDQLHHALSLLARLSTAIFFYEEPRTCWRSFHTSYWLRRDRVTGQGRWHVMMREAYLHTVSTTFWWRLSRSMRHK